MSELNKRISVLDCTLRDGGYVNNWKFGYRNIINILSSLVDTGIDIIECGFLTNRVEYDKNCTKFNSVEQIADLIPDNRRRSMFVCMVNYGEYDIKDLPYNTDRYVDGIRVAFHKNDATNAMKLCGDIQSKGYKVFVQPMATMSYTDREVLELIDAANEIQPYAFYMADSFGAMKQSDIMRFFFLNDNNLDKNIRFGYHSHNNMQLAYSNAQSLCEIETRRNIIIDSSTFGMGRGAGNLNSEMFLSYLNDNTKSEYDIKPLLKIIDEVLSHIYSENYWGYSIPYYLSALHYCHPNYATYLDNKKTLSVDNIDDILKLITVENKSVFNREYIEKLYISYMATGNTYDENTDEFKENIKGKTVLVIAPGKSIEKQKETLIKTMEKDNVISISVNFIYREHNVDYIFVSNIRRYRQMLKKNHISDNKLIGTSNIPQKGLYIQTDYKSLLNGVESVKDNVALMLIKYLYNMGVKKVLIAGVDGYSPIPEENFIENDMSYFIKNKNLEIVNKGLGIVLKEYSKKIDIEFITEHKYVDF